MELGIKSWGTKAKIQERIDAKEKEISSFFEQASESEQEKYEELIDVSIAEDLVTGDGSKAYLFVSTHQSHEEAEETLKADCKYHRNRDGKTERGNFLIFYFL